KIMDCLTKMNNATEKLLKLTPEDLKKSEEDEYADKFAIYSQVEERAIRIKYNIENKILEDFAISRKNAHQEALKTLIDNKLNELEEKKRALNQKQISLDIKNI
ncbi:MAG: hypothetical protein MHPSP_004667, partial [Paramarteilia canceri]